MQVQTQTQAQVQICAFRGMINEVVESIVLPQFRAYLQFINHLNTRIMTDEYFLRRALQLAEESARAGFDPFGAVLVQDGKVVASTTDRSILYSDPTAHAELVLISEYCRTQQLISLEGHTLYSSAEPCIMCSGAIHWARINRVVFCVSQTSLKKTSGGNPKPTCAELVNVGGKKVEVLGPLLEMEGLKILNAFPWRSKKERHEEYLNSNSFLKKKRL